MVQVMIWQRPRYPNWWVAEPLDDPRLVGLFELAQAVTDAADLAWGSIRYDREHPDPELPEILSPLDLAAALRRAATALEDYTVQESAEDEGNTMT